MANTAFVHIDNASGYPVANYVFVNWSAGVMADDGTYVNDLTGEVTLSPTDDRHSARESAARAVRVAQSDPDLIVVHLD